VKINLTGVFFTIQATEPYLNNGASVVLNSLALSVLGAPGYSAYAASKASARAMGRVLASELSPRGIRVNVVTPGGLYADLVRRGS
jgi:NAD(P)-dependent dehydrogenase (short-subunit alcohol dehydrogenase family)